ncbi:glycosyl hydrolase family 28-related protein [uncultured Sphingomonas sp.]|uniref:glycosyl hydrolase family 28-related protein n=1 Tax=uncultured Sphingomonas sp. TaxID=158754 RepID=UPI0025E96EF0|nr:glycosyl hydrolase family 28-related protein [uncultured Sphingomonas sp.]
MVSVKEFGAVGDGSTDDTNALRNALLSCADTGSKLYFPEGIYNYSQPIAIALPERNTFQKGRALNLLGSGSANCGLNWLGGSSVTGLTITGNMPASDRLSISGLRFVRPDPGSSPVGATGAALRLEKLSDVGISDCIFFRHGRGLHLLGCLVVALDRTMLMYNDVGLRCEQANYASSPNVITVRNSNFGTNHSRAVQLIGGSSNGFTNCLFEGTGEDVDATSIAVEIVNPGSAGAVATTFDRCYFENNLGRGVYWYSANDLPQLVAFDNCTFNRLIGRDKESIVVDFSARQQGNAPAMLRLRGSTFYGYNGYVPTPSKPHLALIVPTTYIGMTIAGIAETLHQSDFGTIPNNVSQI